MPVDAARQLTDAIPHTQLAVLNGSGHLLLLDEPTRTAANINELLNRPGQVI